MSYKRAKINGIKIRCINMGGKSNIVRQNDGFERTIFRQRELGGKKFQVLLDGDVFYKPYRNIQDEIKGMRLRADKLAKALQVQISIHWAILAYESWLIGGMKKDDKFCGLKRIAKSISTDTQISPQNPKQWLKDHLSDNEYSPGTQLCLTDHFDIQSAQNNNTSLKEYVKDLQ